MTDSLQSSGRFFLPELVDPRIPYEERRAALLVAARAFLAFHHAGIREEHRRGASGRKVVASLTSVADTLIRNLYTCVSGGVAAGPKDRTTLIAIGGYGRGELNPRSDIDIMFLTEEKEGKEFAKQISDRVLYLLWDLGLEVGFSVRSINDCLEMAEQDLTARTALLDSRPLAGDNALYAQYEKVVGAAIRVKQGKRYIEEKLEERRQRLKKYGSSVYLLEPNIKEGEGGLRDLHTALWVAQVKYKCRVLQELVVKGVMTDQEGAEFEGALDYLWRIRNELHYLAARKTDQIDFEKQEQIAAFLGYHDNRKAQAVEQFMQDYYAHAVRVEHIATSLINKTLPQEKTFGILGYLRRRVVEEGFYILRGELSLTSDDLFAREPALMMRAFLLAQRHNVKMSLTLKGLIRNNLSRVNDKVRRSKIMADGFLEILRSPSGVVETLREMHHLQFLNHFLPEFAHIYCKVQHDAYHIYTVDVHTLFAVEEIGKVWRGDYAVKKPVLTQVAGEIEKRELLLLAVLLHDIGKGEGKDHSNKGAEMVPTIARRLGLSREDSQRLEFLVRQHLVLANTSQRRDLSDDKLIVQIAQTMEMSENLRMLYLLTFADLKAVGPDIWSEWKGRLLQELYEKVYDVLERGDFHSERSSEKVRKRTRKVLELLKDEFDPRILREYVKSLSTRYLLAHRSSEIAEHLRIVLQRGAKTVQIFVRQDREGEYSEIMVTTLDAPGLFSLITGVMAANSLNILGAEINTLSNGVALDILQVRSATGEMVTNPRKWEQVESDLTAVIEGRVRVDELVRKQKRPDFLTPKARPRYPTRVDIDNSVSAEYTVIDIFAHDQVGLLYQMTRTLKDLGLYIGVSRISTKVDQAADTFYVKDIFGQKIRDEERLAAIRQQLIERIGEEI
jgi:[protein-PII] uridylyltransferase